MPMLNGFRSDALRYNNTTMKRFLVFSTLLLALPLAAQITPERLAADPLLATDVYRTYEYSPALATRPPRGYKPVYISHFGRHGERYINRESYFLPGLEVLEREALTPLGERARKEISNMVKRTEGNLGYLSPLGAKNHRAIANRLFHKFRRVFRRGRTVRCASTEVPRCIVSMASAGTALSSARPGLIIEYRIDEKLRCYIQEPWLREYLLGRRDSLFAAHPSSLDCIKDCFADASRLSRKELTAVADALFYTWKDLPCLDLEAFDIKDFFSDELFLLFARQGSSWDYCLLSRSPWWNRELLRPLTDDILIRAEEALGRNDIAADLRFGHDSQLIPLYTLLGLTGNGHVLGYDEAPDVWDPATVCPMASSLQIVFYKNRKGNVLVKVLKNEHEFAIPALTPVKGPYYLWQDLAEILKHGE